MRGKGCWVGDRKIRFALLFLAKKPSQIGASDYRQPSQNHHRTTVGAGLLAKGPCQSTLISFDPPHSRASPLPQGIYAESGILQA
ncbi:hypothetical protein C3E97_010465 [Pseudomonas sp. MWU12-2115]|nr:hypothetical protein C3E97_010465 [Pseudomonas sp. MWU12-2115]